MHAYEFVLLLLSFVYAAAVTHILSVAGEIIIASKRVRPSWFNAGLGLGGSAVQWPVQNRVIVPMNVATGVAAIVIRRPWVQACAVAIQVLGWLWYFAKLQSALSG